MFTANTAINKKLRIHIAMKIYKIYFLLYKLYTIG